MGSEDGKRFCLSIECLSLSSAEQGALGLTGDTAFTGSFVVGETRFAQLRDAVSERSDITVKRARNSGNQFAFGGSTSLTKHTYAITRGKITIKVDVVGGDARGLPFLFGKHIFRACKGMVDYGGVPESQIVLRGKTLKTWGEMPTVDFLTFMDVAAGAGDIHTVLRTNPDTQQADTAQNVSAGGTEKENTGKETTQTDTTQDVDEVDGKRDDDVKMPDDLDEKYVKVRHDTTHAQPDRLLKSILFAFRELSQDQARQLSEWCEKVVRECELCGQFGKRTTAGTSLRPALAKNERGHLDLVCLNQKQDFWALMIVDEGTRDLMFPVVLSRGAVDVFRAYIIAWGCNHGCHRFMYTDGDGCFASTVLKGLCTEFGIVKDAGPGEASESYGIVERAIGTARLTTDRVGADPNGPKTREEWQLTCALTANGIRNEVRVGGTTASERSIGSSSSVFSNFLSDLEVKGHTGVSKHRLAQLKDLTQREFYAALTSDKLKLLGKERRTRARRVLVGSFELGERIEFFREVESGRGASWRIGRICGIVPSSDGNGVDYFHVDDAGALYRCAPRHIRKSGIVPVVELEPVVEAFTEGGQFKYRTEKKGGGVEGGAGVAEADQTPRNFNPHIHMHPDKPPQQEVPDAQVNCAGVCDHGTLSEPCDSDFDDGLTGRFPDAPEKKKREKGKVTVTEKQTSKKKEKAFFSEDILFPKGEMPDDGTTPPPPLLDDDDDTDDDPESFSDSDVDSEDSGGSVETVLLSMLLAADNKGTTSGQVGTCGLSLGGEVGVANSSREDGKRETKTLTSYATWKRRGRQKKHRREAQQKKQNVLAATEAHENKKTQADNTPHLGEALGKAKQGDFSKLSGMDAYSWDFSDLTPDEQLQSRQRAVADYDEFNAWDRKTDLSEQQMLEHLKRNPTAVKLPAGFVDKAKIIAGILKGKSRYTPRGFRDIFRFSEDCQSPTVNQVLLRLIIIWGLREGMTSFQLDFAQAFFQTELEFDREVWVEIPEIDRKGDKRWRRLLKAVPGTNAAPRHWFETISRWLKGQGFRQSRYDSAVFMFPAVVQGKHEWSLILPLHVDDGQGVGRPAAVAWFRKLVDASLGGRWKIGTWVEPKLGEESEFVGGEYKEVVRDGVRGIEVSQDKYCEKKLKDVNVGLVGDDLESSYRAALGTSLWAATHSQTDHAYDIALGAQKVNSLTVDDATTLNKAIASMRTNPLRTFIPKLDKKLRQRIAVIKDAGMGDSGSWVGGQGAMTIGLMEDGPEASDKFASVYTKSGKFKRTTGSSFDGECVVAHDAATVVLFIQGFLCELEFGLRPNLAEALQARLDGVTGDGRVLVAIDMYSDSHGLVRKMRNAFNTADLSKRRVEDIADLRECIKFNRLRIHHINGVTNPADALTKVHAKSTKTRKILRELLETGKWTPDFSNVYLGKADRKITNKKVKAKKRA